MSIPAKNDIVINPKTQRPLRVGGRAWLKLVKEGVLSGHYTDPKKIAPLPDNHEEIEEEIKRINKTLPKGKQAVRGRGRYSGQITTRNIQPDTEDVRKYTSQMASKVVKDNIEALQDCDDIEAELEKLILQEMAKGKTKKKGRPQKQNEYVLEEPQYEEEELEQEQFFSDNDIDYFEDE